MDLTPYLANLRQDLASMSDPAQAGDEDARRSAAVLSAAIEPAARLALMNALSDMAAEVTSQLPEHTVDVRLDGRDVKVVVTPLDSARSATAEEPPKPPSGGDTTGDISRMTLRLVEEMKSRAEQAAAAQGVSLNSFVSQAVQGALSGNRWNKPGQDGGSTMRGWAEW